MKIPHSVRDIYEEQFPLFKELGERVTGKIDSRKPKDWHYTGRVKELESFALKVETGRFDPRRLEDFFACTLVVENQLRVREAESLICDLFGLEYRKPPKDNETHKSYDAFPFDDLRLYVTYKDEPNVRPSGFEGVLFEVQIKTFLQHAWSIATHDLIYKGATISWPTARIAFQIKAMLEHAEVSISAAQTLAQSSELTKTNESVDRLNTITLALKELWPNPENLPTDLRKLAENTDTLCYALRIEIGELKEIILRETAADRGIKTLNLSPYGIILQSLIGQAPDKIKMFLSKPSRKFKLFLPSEIELPSELRDLPACSQNVVMCNADRLL